MNNEEKMREVTVFELEESPRTVQVPESLIREFEEKVAPFTNMRASALLVSAGCNKTNYTAYSIEEITEKLIFAMKEEIASSNEMDEVMRAYISAGEPNEFQYKKDIK